MSRTAREPHRCSVLIVDDDAEARELIRVALAAEGYRVAAVPDGREALQRLRSTPETCIIVLDLGMPRMDAAAFRAAQLRDRSLAWIPVVVVSGAVDARQRARELEARSFVGKPLDLDQLRRTLRYIGCSKARPSAGRRASASPSIRERVEAERRG